jgi:hypothetical protein
MGLALWSLRCGKMRPTGWHIFAAPEFPFILRCSAIHARQCEMNFDGYRGHIHNAGLRVFNFQLQRARIWCAIPFEFRELPAKAAVLDHNPSSDCKYAVSRQRRSTPRADEWWPNWDQLSLPLDFGALWLECVSKGASDHPPALGDQDCAALTRLMLHDGLSGIRPLPLENILRVQSLAASHLNQRGAHALTDLGHVCRITRSRTHPASVKRAHQSSGSRASALRMSKSSAAV